MMEEEEEEEEDAWRQRSESEYNLYGLTSDRYFLGCVPLVPRISLSLFHPHPQPSPALHLLCADSAFGLTYEPCPSAKEPAASAAGFLCLICSSEVIRKVCID